MKASGWEKQLLALFESERGRPFAWGSADCATFAADAVRVVAGVDAMGALRGSYASRLQARARMRARGWRTMADAAAGLLVPAGAVEVPPRFAPAGAIGVTADDVLCVRFPWAFVARASNGEFMAPQSVARAWMF